MTDSLNDTVAPARENCQTTKFCQRLGIDNPFRPLQPANDDSCGEMDSKNPDEISLGSSDGEEEERTDESANIAGCTREGVAWSVETRPGLDLPPPSRSHDNHVTVQTDRESADTSKTECHDDTADIDGSTDEQESRKSSAGQGTNERRLVIKRRNQALYEEPTDDSRE